MSARPDETGSRSRAPLAAPALLEALRAADSRVEHSPLGPVPWLYVDVRAEQVALPGCELEPLLQWLASRACPVIGLDPARDGGALAGCCDVVVSDDAEAQALIDNIAGAPLAAMTLVQVLRATERLPLTEALSVESMGYSTLQAGPEFQSWRAGRPNWAAARKPLRAGARGAPLRIERTGGTLTITLVRPERRNALSVELRDALVEAFELVSGDAALVSVVVQGEGPDFCAGGDLAEFGTAPDPATAHAVRTARSPAAALASCSDRVAFRVHGACVGAGVELAAFGRRVIASADSWFQLPELSFGLIPGAGGCVSLPRRIGRQRAAWLALSGRRIDAPTALAWGLIDQIGDMPHFHKRGQSPFPPANAPS